MRFSPSSLRWVAAAALALTLSSCSLTSSSPDSPSESSTPQQAQSQAPSAAPTGRPTPGQLPVPTEEMMNVPEDAPVASFGIWAVDTDSICMVDEAHTLLCVVNNAQWGSVCGAGRTGAITLNAGVPDLACVEGHFGAVGSSLDDPETGSTILLDDGAIACTPGPSVLSCWDTGSHHGFVANEHEYRFF